MPNTASGAVKEEQVFGATNHHKPSNEYVLNVAFVSFLGFMLVQIVFALMVGSESMLADSEAMGIDAMTYLFNLCAERVKNAPLSKKELELYPEERQYHRKLKRLYLELIPPLISVSALIAVTIFTVRDAIHTLFSDEPDASSTDEDEKVGVMLFFSTLNLLLDVLNVSCFARADQAFGFSVMQSQGEFRKGVTSIPEEHSLLTENQRPVSYDGEGIEVQELNVASGSLSTDVSSSSEESFALVNLNMCSAWTHVCADTMRSVAVLIAAGIAFLFEAVSPDAADAAAAMVVSIIIIVSLLPLIQGLCLTATEIWMSSKRYPRIGDPSTNLTV